MLSLCYNNPSSMSEDNSVACSEQTQAEPPENLSVVISALLLNTGVNLKRTCAVLNLLCVQGLLQGTHAAYLPAKC